MKKLISLFLLIFALTTFAAFPKLVKVKNLKDFSFDVAAVKNKVFDVLVYSKDELNKLSKKAKILSVEDLSAKFDWYYPAPSQDELRANYSTYSEIKNYLEKIAKEGKAKLLNLGKTFEGRDILAIEFSSNSLNKKENLLFIGLHHAREWISSQAAFEFVKFLAENPNSKEVKDLLKDYNVYVIPVLNPDGLEYSMFKYTMWRKNRRKFGTNYGVDPNRNYGYHWGEAGAGSSPADQTYRGPSAFSEAETQAVRNLVLKIKPKGVISLHSYSQLVLYPFGYTKDPAPHQADLHKLAADMAKVLGGFTPEAASSLYPASGIELDWLYAVGGAYPFVFELGKWFIPEKKEEIKQICDNVRKAFLLFAKELKPLPRIKVKKLPTF